MGGTGKSGEMRLENSGPEGFFNGIVNKRKDERVTGATGKIEGKRKWGRKKAWMNEFEVSVMVITTELRDWILCSKKQPFHEPQILLPFLLH
jgi:hypothetical protein